MLEKFHVGSADLGCWDLYHSNQPMMSGVEASRSYAFWT